MPAALLPRDEVVARILTVFRDFGFDGASLAELSKATGLGRSSLYHYFPGGKDEMAVAVLERIDTWMRERALAAFQAARVQVLVGTDVAARGIHVDDVGCVVHFDPPEDGTTYVHRSGRTGRAAVGRVGRKRKQFFFEKKNQKTFTRLGTGQ